MKNINVKQWYLKQYPTDEMREDINPKITFEDVFNTLDNYQDVYNLIGVKDSIIRERIFEELSILSGHTYEEIYNQWLLA